MAWPFSTPASGPTSFGGPGATVPSSATEIGGGAAVWLLGLQFRNNNTTTPRTVTVTNTAGDLLWKETIAPDSGSQPYAPTFEPTTGIKWSVDSGSDVVGHVWGY